MADVLHIGMMLGKPLRFVRAPGEGPRFPWVVESDLAKAMNLSRNHRRVMKMMTDEGEAGDDAMIVRIDGKAERCISHSLARGLMDAIEISRLREAGEIEAAQAIDADITTSPMVWAYVAAAKAAMDEQTKGMSDGESFVFFLDAMKAENGGAQ